MNSQDKYSPEDNCKQVNRYDNLQGNCTTYSQEKKRPTALKLILSYIMNGLNFKGRIDRYDFWVSLILMIPISIVLAILIRLIVIVVANNMTDEILILILVSITSSVVIVPFVIAILAMMFRRATDVGLTKKGYLVVLIGMMLPYLGFASTIFNLVLLCLKSNSLETSRISGFSAFMFRPNKQVLEYYSQFNPHQMMTFTQSQEISQQVNRSLNLQDSMATQTQSYNNLHNNHEQTQVEEKIEYNVFGDPIIRKINK